MDKTQRLHTLIFGLMIMAGLWGCGDNDDDIQITGPEGYETRSGTAYPIKEVSFLTSDDVQVSALFAQRRDSSEKMPVVILVHDFTQTNQEWFFTSIYMALLNQGYLTLALNLRGHGTTPLPDDREFFVIDDLENGYLDVQAALIWLRNQPEVDNSRIAVVGTGLGGNIAYVSMGVFPTQVKTAVALSPGFWDPNNNYRSMVVGTGLDSFAPHSMLFMVGGDNIFQSQDGDELSSVVVATDLHEATDDPKQLRIFEGSVNFGLELLCDPGVLGCDPEAQDLLLSWLNAHL